MPRAFLRLFSLIFSALDLPSRWRSRFAAVWAISVLFALPLFGRCVYLHLFHVADSTDHAYGTVWALVMLTSFRAFSGSFGINGPNITSPIFTPILTALTLENQAVFAAGTALPNIINREFDAFCAVWWRRINPFAVDCDIFVLQFAVQKTLQRSPLCLVFGINEPVMYGLPILNSLVAIPLITPVNVF